MAPNPDPQPDHPLLKGLDKVFVGDGGYAPALVGWLSYLAHPEEHEGPRRLEMWYGMSSTGVEKEVKNQAVTRWAAAWHPLRRKRIDSTRSRPTFVLRTR